MNRFVFPVFAIILLVATACEREEDDILAKPTPTSITIKGTVCTLDGQPFAGIPVCVDYEFRSIVAHIVKHKGKATTDKNGNYSVFFEVGEDKAPAGDVQSQYCFSVDLSGVSPETYIRPEEKLDFYLRVEDREGETLNCDFTIPFKKYVKVNVENSGLPVTDGHYAVKNSFPYGSGWGMLNGKLNNSEYSDVSWLYLFEAIEIPAEGSHSVMLPCGVGITNTVQLVYRGRGETPFGSGLQLDDARELYVSDSSDEELTFKYTVPDI